ncbi:unnamed protein product [Callosobruchus maculatus]|uniref:Uncharacterized protein n=1 Tax=Callosobruchus maculatus TaxID=64391 RepID=A0A653CA95_CALMS|nr:unnamed protein product [Callosobruchus maculatus]
MVLCYSVFQRHPSEVSEMCRKRWKPVFLCVVLIFKFTESTPIGHNQIIDFRDDWNYKTDPGDVPLLKEGMGKFLTAFYHYSETQANA